MQTLSNLKNDKANGMQKILAFGLLAAVVWGVIKLLNAILPSINELIENVWKLILFGTPLVLITLYVVSNPLVIWGFFKTLSYKLTSWLVKMDPLSVMDRYVEYLRKKLANLQTTVTVLQGKKEKLERKITTLENQVRNNIKMGAAAKTTGNNSAASVYGIKITTDKGTLAMLEPLHKRLDRNLVFLKKLDENWSSGIEQLTYQIAAKRDEYEIIRETTKGLKSAEDFINSDNEAARVYGMSLQALEEEVTQKIGYIDEFERRSKDIMSAIDIEKQANTDEGLAELEKYLENGKVTMPDFSKFGGVQDVDYVEVKQTTASKFKLTK